MSVVERFGWREWADAGLGVGVALVGVFELTQGAKFHFQQGGLAVALSLLTTLPLVFRRRAPLAVAGLVLVGVVLQEVLRQATPASTYFVLLINTYSVAALSRHVVAGLVLLATAAAAAPHILDNGPHPDSGDFIFTFLPMTLAFVVGVLQRRKLLRIGFLQHEVSLSEQLADERAERAAAEERARIARELHDVVAHRMSVITMQAAAARRVTQGQPKVALDALAAIENQSREALGEMRRLLDVMRLHRESGPELAPQPGLAELDALAGQVRAAGLPLDVTVRGAARPLSPGLDLSAYRILQEALTNVLKHAAGAETRVLVSYGEKELELEVVSRGAATASPGLASGGHGLVGMRERAALFGGRVTTGPAAGGYRVHALLPMDAAPAAG